LLIYAVALPCLVGEGVYVYGIARVQYHISNASYLRLCYNSTDDSGLAYGQTLFAPGLNPDTGIENLIGVNFSLAELNWLVAELKIV
jgi:hypothetical protein